MRQADLCRGSVHVNVRICRDQVRRARVPTVRARIPMTRPAAQSQAAAVATRPLASSTGPIAGSNQLALSSRAHSPAVLRASRCLPRRCVPRAEQVDLRTDLPATESAGSRSCRCERVPFVHPYAEVSISIRDQQCGEQYVAKHWHPPSACARSPTRRSRSLCQSLPRGRADCPILYGAALSGR